MLRNLVPSCNTKVDSTLANEGGNVRCGKEDERNG